MPANGVCSVMGGNLGTLVKGLALQHCTPETALL